jgi:hypothetical protein
MYQFGTFRLRLAFSYYAFITPSLKLYVHPAPRSHHLAQKAMKTTSMTLIPVDLLQMVKYYIHIFFCAYATSLTGISLAVVLNACSIRGT